MENKFQIPVVGPVIIGLSIVPAVLIPITRRSVRFLQSVPHYSELAGGEGASGEPKTGYCHFRAILRNGSPQKSEIAENFQNEDDPEISVANQNNLALARLQTYEVSTRTVTELVKRKKSPSDAKDDGASLQTQQKLRTSRKLINERLVQRKNLYLEMRGANNSSDSNNIIFNISNEFLSAPKFEFRVILDTTSGVPDFALFKNEIGNTGKANTNVNVNINIGNTVTSSSQPILGDSDKKIDHYKHVVEGCELDKEYTIIGYVNEGNLVDTGADAKEVYHSVASLDPMDQIIQSKRSSEKGLKIAAAVGFVVGACATLYEVYNQ